MTDQVELKAEIREKVGSTSAAKLRNAGKCPAVVYGHGEEPVSIAVDVRDLTTELHEGHRLFDVDLAGKKDTVMIKDLQYDHFGREVIHADFVRVNLAEVVRVTIDVEMKGIAAGTQEGGILDVHLAQIEVECKVSSIPGAIEFVVKEVKVGDTVHASDIELPEGVKLVTDPEAVMLTCHLVVEAKTTEELEEELPSGPEVITEKPAEEGEGE